MNKTQISLDRKRAAMTEAFVKAVETAGKWLPDWICTTPRNFLTGKAYRGINSVMLPLRAMVEGWETPLYAGKGQIKEAGGRIKEGQMNKASWVFFWGSFEKEYTDGVTGEKTKRKIWFPKAFQVWNVCQIEGVKPERIKGLTTETVSGAERDEAAEALLRGYMRAEGIGFAHADTTPCYIPMLDAIRMPRPESFDGTNPYYNAMAHEAAHSTGHSTRLDREIMNNHGDHRYSKEELVAQLAAAFIRADLGLTAEREEARDAAYLKSWLDAMRADPSMLFDAAGDADKAARYIREKAGVETPEAVEA